MTARDSRAKTTVVVALALAVFVGVGCGDAGRPRTSLRPAGALRLLKGDGYRPVESVAIHQPGTIGWAVMFDTHYGHPVAYVEKGGLRVLIARGGPSTPRPAGALWHRSGETIVMGWSSRPANVAQFKALVAQLG